MWRTIGAVGVSACLLFASSCENSSREQRFYRVSASADQSESGQAWMEAGSSLYDVYLEGRCGDDIPILEDSTILTPACDLQEAEMLELLRRAGLENVDVEVIPRSAYEEVIERSARSRVAE